MRQQRSCSASYCWVAAQQSARRLLITQVFFELLSFPLIKTLTGVFSCTSAGIWAEPDFGTQRGATLVCEETVPDGAQCMDMSHAVVCWTSGTHHGYLATVVVLLVPYYMACLHLQLAANRAQSAVSIDGTWSITVTQCKFMLAIIASSFGDCYPIIIAVSVQLVVIGQLVLLFSGRDYSNVHSLNAIRFTGLLCGWVNGLFAVYVLWHYRDDPAGGTPCSSVGGGGSGSGPATRLVNEYGTFYGLVVANALALIAGCVWYWGMGRTWSQVNARSDEEDGAFELRYPDLEAIKVGLHSVNDETQRANQQVDYLVVKQRLDLAEKLLDKAKKLLAAANRTEEAVPFTFDLYTSDDASGQNLEKVTLDEVLGRDFLAEEDSEVRLLGVNPDEKSGLMVMELFETMQDGGVRSWKTCRLACCARHYGSQGGLKKCRWLRYVARVNKAKTRFVTVSMKTRYGVHCHRQRRR